MLFRSFLSDLFAETRDSLRLPPQLVQNLSPHALSTISAGEGSILSILCAAVSGIVTINKQLDTVNTRLVELSKENEQLREKIHDVSSVLANDVATSEELRPLISALRDLSHRVSAPPPPRQPPQAPQAQRPTTTPARPPPLRQAKIPHPHPMIHPPLPALLTPPSTAPITTPTLVKCSATPSCTPRPSPTRGKRSNFAPANMTCRNLPQQPNTRTTNPNTSPPMPRLPAPAGPGGKQERRQPRPKSPIQRASPQNPRLPSPSPPAVSLPSEKPPCFTPKPPASPKPSPT